MYRELTGPLADWTYDDQGVIYTRSGYRCTEQQLESALWLLGCWSSESRKYWIRSDEAPGALRRLYDPADHAAGLTPEKRVLRAEAQDRDADPRATLRTRERADGDTKAATGPTGPKSTPHDENRTRQPT